MQVKVGIGVIIYKENKVLLGKRINAHGENTWSFPGGHLEYGESWSDCAHREVKEETGIEIDDLSHYHTTNDIFNKEQKHYITIFIQAKYKSGLVEILEPKKCEEWKWFDKNNLPEKLFLPIQNLLKEKRNL